MIRFLVFDLSAVLLSFGCALAQEAPGEAPAPRKDLEVREVTVFKDGHAFVLRDGPLVLDASGDVVLDELPVPVLGTFWPYASSGAKLVSATARKERVRVERTAIDVRQLIEGNVGHEAVIVDSDGRSVEGRILAVPQRSAEELERVDPGRGPARLPEKGSIVLIQNAEGTQAIPLDRVRGVTLRGPYETMHADDELRDRLELHVEPEAGGLDPGARIGIVYVQKGLRWIPAYELDIDGAGKAEVRFEATLVDDLVDLRDATVHLVIGVPRFEFADWVDPISLQEVAADVARQTQSADRFSSFLSNAIMTQSSAFAVQGEPAPGAPAPELEGAESNEDLFVFTVRHVTLARGERMVLPIASFTLSYRDVYTLEVPFAPPVELRDNFQADRMSELARLLTSPKAVHALRFTNDSSAPLTTAPALLLRSGRVLAQNLSTYTPIGAESDLPLTTAVDVGVEKTEKEAGRTPDAVEWDGNRYYRIDMTGTIELVNRKKEAIDLEVRRSVLGLVDAVDSGGTFEQKSLSEAWFSSDRPSWWSWWSWPYWFQHWNGIGRIEWAVHLEPGATATLGASWHYFWR